METYSRFFLCGALFVFGLSAFAQTKPNLEIPAATSSIEGGQGIVVDAIQKDLEAEKAGLREGDVLLSWVRGDANGEFQSPFDLSDIEIEQAPRGTVTLTGSRGREKKTWMLGPARWGIDVRPNLTERFLTLYLEGQKLAAAGKVQDAAERLRSAAGKAQESQSAWIGSWFLLHAGQLLAEARQWKDADAAYDEAMQKSAGAGPKIKTLLLWAWAKTFEQRADWANAELHYQEAAEESRKSGNEGLRYADTLNAMGSLAWRRRDLDSCEKYNSQALEIQKKLAPESLNLAKSLSSLGVLAWTRGDLVKAEEYFLQSLAINEELAPESLVVAASLNNLGLVSVDRGDLAKAEQYHQRAFAIRKRIDPESLDVAKSLNNLALVFQWLGDLAKAEEYGRQALALKEKLVPESLEVALCLLNLGNIALEHGDLDKSEQYHREALAIEEKLAPGGLEVARSLGNLGSVAQERGDLAKAEDYQQRALAIQQKLAPGSLNLAVTLHNLGDIAQQRDDLATADRYYLQALAIKEKLAPGSLTVAESLTSLGNIALGRENLTRAEEYYLQALAIREKQSPDSIYVAQSLTNLGTVVRNRGDLVKAEEYYRQGLAIWKGLAPEKKDYAEALAALAGVMVRKQQLDLAAPLFDQAVNVLENQMNHFGGGEEIRSDFRAQHAGYYRSYIDLLVRQKQPELAFQVLERSRTRTLLEMLAAARIDVRRGVDAALLEQEHMLQADISARIDRRIRLQGSPHMEEQVAAVSQEIEGLLAQHKEVEGQIRVNSPAYAALTQPQPLSAKEIQTQLLDAGTVLLEYSLGMERSYVFAVTPTSLDAYELPKRAEIEAAARQLYEQLISRNRKIQGKAEPDYSEAAAALSRMVLTPVAAQLQGKRLLIVSDGALQYIPFAVLPQPEALDPYNASAKAQPLLVEHEIVNLPSASVLAVLRGERIGRKEATKAVAVLADPVFTQNDGRVRAANTVQAHVREIAHGSENNKSEDNKSGEETSASLSRTRLTRSMVDVGLSPDGISLSRLRFTRREAEAIMAVTPARDGMKALDFDASRATATSPELAQYRVVHFATHGLLDNEHPELSGLVLSLVDENGKQQNGFLELEDIYNLNLPVELVVLSACETGLGKEIQGEGLVGLTRGFMYAGASRVLASLWKVDDVATAELMGKFYSAMEKNGLPPAAALRKAQIEMWKQKDWSSPYYWAAFQLQGEWK